jgi:hypothetical protein
VQPDVIFVDAVAVSHRHHPGACQLMNAMFVSADSVQRNVLENVHDGSFQHRGLGSFLLAPLAHIAIWQCPDGRVIYLKCPKARSL